MCSHQPPCQDLEPGVAFCRLEEEVGRRQGEGGPGANRPGSGPHCLQVHQALGLLWNCWADWPTGGGKSWRLALRAGRRGWRWQAWAVPRPFLPKTAQACVVHATGRLRQWTQPLWNRWTRRSGTQTSTSAKGPLTWGKLYCIAWRMQATSKTCSWRNMASIWMRPSEITFRFGRKRRGLQLLRGMLIFRPRLLVRSCEPRRPGPNRKTSRDTTFFTALRMGHWPRTWTWRQHFIHSRVLPSEPKATRV